MGYYVRTQGGEFRIPADKIDDAYRAVCTLNERDDLKRGGTWERSEDGTVERRVRWFSWMDENYPVTCQTLEEVLQALGFVCYTDPSTGWLAFGDYDHKRGQEELFLATIAPFADRDSFFEWVGEDGEQWRHTINDDGALVVWSAEIVYTSPTLVTVGGAE